MHISNKMVRSSRKAVVLHSQWYQVHDDCPYVQKRKRKAWFEIARVLWAIKQRENTPADLRLGGVVRRNHWRKGCG